VVLEKTLESLQALLNTRRGSLFYRPDYRLPDLHWVATAHPDPQSVLQEASLHIIRTYEPRLTRVTLIPFEDALHPTRLRYVIQAWLRDRQRVDFNTEINNRQATVMNVSLMDDVCTPLAVVNQRMGGSIQ